MIFNVGLPIATRLRLRALRQRTPHEWFAWFPVRVQDEGCDGVKALEKYRDDLTRITGIRHVLDHITPLNHPLVCGLNVHTNLRVVRWRANASKSNTWRDPWHGDLFEGS